MASLICYGTSKRSDLGHNDFRWDRFATGDLLRNPHPYVRAGEMR